MIKLSSIFANDESNLSPTELSNFKFQSMREDSLKELEKLKRKGYPLNLI